MSFRLIAVAGLLLAVLLLGPCGRSSIEPIVFPETPRNEFHSSLQLEAEPLQRALDWPYDALAVGDYQISPVAEFQLEARILGRRDYRWDPWSALSPMDLALGWGRMADPAVLSAIRIRQGGRFYFWRAKEFPIPRQEIERSSANMHLIPADAAVYRQLRRARAGQTIRLLGYLVNVDRADGWRWRTSLIREDTGDGACEIVLVVRAELN